MAFQLSKGREEKGNLEYSDLDLNWIFTTQAQSLISQTNTGIFFLLAF
jgi:hypothetical protein